LLLLKINYTYLYFSMCDTEDKYLFYIAKAYNI